MATPQRRSQRLPRETNWSAFIALADDDRRELIAGELVETEMPTELHEFIVLKLGSLLMQWAEEHGGVALASAYKVRIDAEHGFMPDLQLYRAESKAVRERHALTRGHPDLVVEILSTGSAQYDRVTKLLGYAAIGVPEYWLVDQFAHTLERLLLKRGGYVVESVMRKGETLTPPTFPGLVVSVDRLFALPSSKRRRS